VVFIFVVVLAVGLMKYFDFSEGRATPRPNVETKRFVKTREVKYDVIISPVGGQGRISSVSEIDIVAEASGKIISGAVPLKKESEFSKADLLFTIYPDEVILALKARKSHFLNMLATLLPDINIDYPDQLQIFNSFFTSIDIDKDLPEFPNIDEGKIKLFLASRNVLSEYYSIIKDELRLSRHSVFAPFDGTYTQVNLEVGAYTNAGGKVAHAIRTDELELEVPVERSDAEWIKIGDQVTIQKLPEEDLEAMTDFSREYMEEFNSKDLGVKLEMARAFLDILDSRLALLSNNGLIGLILVIISLSLFLSVRLSL